MNGIPKSWKALRLAVMYARLPRSLDGKAGKLLSCLAESARIDGTNAHPGNLSLQAAVGLEWSATHELMNKTIAAGLCKRTFVPHGRPSKAGDAKATVYALCLDNPAYPDYAPNGECLIETPENKGEKNVRPNRTVDAKKSGSEGENIRPDTVKHPGPEAKTSGLLRSTSVSYQEHNQPPSKPEKASFGKAGVVE